MESSKPSFSRRDFIKKNSLAAAGAVLASVVSKPVFAAGLSQVQTPAILGGKAAWSTSKWPEWPIWNPATDEKQVLEVLRSGIWSRAEVVTQFEKEWASTLGVKRSLAVVNGTNALVITLNQFDIKAGDEVLVPPYTFIATVSSVLSNGAIPVFVDVDPETFQMDPAKIEAKITPRTKAIMPVHILGLPADMDKIMAIAKKHNLLVIEDACQAHLAEINKQKVGTIGDAGCFSFQNSKNLPIGEGGAIVSNNEKFIDRCYSYHNFGYAYGTAVGAVSSGCIIQGTKLRFTEYQAAIGLAQLKRLDSQTTTRNENAAYLKSQIKDIPGIIPYKLYDNVTRAAFHLFPFRYQKNAFSGLSREAFIKALTAEGVPCSSGYATLNTQPYLKDTFESKNYKKMYPADMLNINTYNEHNKCPNNDLLCNEEAVWFTQNMLLGSKTDMQDIASAIEKVHKNSAQIKKLGKR
ncbi:aminotransferase class I/II-fold pyridoxal phosphate-dependent enzyme [Dyadobacter frigoris]|uniref:Aminotransferase class I/II-fold pyridoxal phosphate-dependent enzyme n=1 Tax=Dyadobacter frigoris TaxID=2576211 RepID=A0A4U6CTF5_9BACT|nr:aminotransferase class I/II-fold pyridoxal phosphate-dependent enzyme [Dyadobacter frigoris]TKT87950.1 aminotransferase class I/II-fold pyridoxal phosphate-dependent enzyme [Dyadobacter frigoris]